MGAGGGGQLRHVSPGTTRGPGSERRRLTRRCSGLASLAAELHIVVWTAMQTIRYLLLVIDLLNDYFRQHAGLAAQRGQLVASVNRLAAAFRQARQPVLWVRQEFAPDLSDAFLRMRRENLRVTIAGTDGCERLPELERHASDRCSSRSATAPSSAPASTRRSPLCVRESWSSPGSTRTRVSARRPSLLPRG